MIENFIKKAEIEEIGPVKLELYNDSNFIESIKGNNTLLHLPEINYTEKYLSKLQKDFIKEEKEVIEPIEIKAPNIDKCEYLSVETDDSFIDPKSKNIIPKKDKIKYLGQYINQDGTVTDPLNAWAYYHSRRIIT